MVGVVGGPSSKAGTTVWTSVNSVRVSVARRESKPRRMRRLPLKKSEPCEGDASVQILSWNVCRV
jgi:hypothetical protein